MIHWVLLLAWACTGVVQAQPIACNDDSQCTSGYYCRADVHICLECLRCEDLNREPPRTALSCIRSIGDCGSCLKGLVYDGLGEVDAACKEPEAGAGGDATGLPAYVWVVVVVCLLLFGLVLVALVYMLRHTDTFKILASTRTSVQTPVVSAGAAPSAPQPPPYNYTAQYEPVRPSSPPLPPTHYDPSVPLVKRAPSSRGRDARESAGSQNARVYSNPAYVRNAQPPPSYDSAFSDDSDHEAPFVPHDEDTMESPWTPGNSTNDNNTDANGNDNTAPSASVAEAESASGSTAPALRRPARTEVMSPPAKRVCDREDSNNNSSSRGAGGGGEPSGPLPPAAPSLVINVLNVNSVRQLNDVSL